MIGEPSLFSDVLGPQLGFFLDETLHQGNTVRVFGDHDLNPAGAQEFFVSTEIGGVSDDHTGNAKLDDRSRTHHAG